MTESSTVSEVLDAARRAFAMSKDTDNGRTTEEWWAIRDAAFAEFDTAIEAAGKIAVAHAFLDVAANPEARNRGTGVSVNWLRSEARNLAGETK